MRKILLLLLLCLCSELVLCAKPLRIACIGDSITYGSRIEEPEKNSYPAQLSALLGERYIVNNFGISGRTMLFDSDRPYVKTQLFNEVFDFKPDLIFIMLGTNDSKSAYKDIQHKFSSDYKRMLDSLQSALPGAKIVLMTPPRCYTAADSPNINGEYIAKTIVPAVQKIAYDAELEIINIHSLFGTDYLKDYMPDRVHPSRDGASLIALRLHDFIVNANKTLDYEFDSTLKDDKNFYGYKLYEFTFEGRKSKVVVPKKVAKGKPWLWRARFWDISLVDLDIALLERGYHIVYNDVANMFGSDNAVAQWAKFYDYTQKQGLAKKCIIEAYSRGGLIAYNYAAKYPETVAAIYADAPVLDIKSWPMRHQKSVKQQQLLIKAYGFTSEEQVADYKQNPIDKTQAIAKGGFAMIHVCGTADTTVPVEDNTLPFIEKIRSAGSDVYYYPKEGVAHHPHGYSYNYPNGVEYPDPIIKQLLLSSGMLK